MRLFYEHAQRARTWLEKSGGFIGSVVLERKHKNYDFFFPLKPRTIAHAVCGRPTLNVFERFMKGSLRGLYERSIYERTFLSERTENHAISNEPSNVNHAKKHLLKHYRVFRCDREPSRIPIQTLERLRSKNRKVREFVYKGIRSCTPKSSKVHCYVKVKKQRNKTKFLFKGSGPTINV